MSTTRISFYHVQLIAKQCKQCLSSLGVLDFSLKVRASLFGYFCKAIEGTDVWQLASGYLSEISVSSMVTSVIRILYRP